MVLTLYCLMMIYAQGLDYCLFEPDILFNSNHKIATVINSIIENILES